MSKGDGNCYGSHPGQEPSSSNLIINYLPQKLTDQDFHDMFAKIGPIKTCKIVRNKQTGYSYGFGFVDYHDPSDAERAIQEYNGYRMDNKTLKVAIAKPADSDHSKNANVYIRGVPKTFDAKELEQTFAQFGKMVQFRVLRDESHGINKGVAFALYDEVMNAEKAIREMNGKMLPGGMECLTVKLADDQVKLKKQRQMNQMDGGMSMGMGHSGMGGGGMMGMSGGPRGGGPGGPMFARGGPFTANFGGGGRPNHRFNPMTGGKGMGGGMGGSNMYDYNSQARMGGGGGSQGGGYVLFAYNIGLETDDSSLYDLFSQYGQVEKATALKDKVSGKGKGYGFVTMNNYDEACWAIENLTGFHYAGKPLQVSFKNGKTNGGGGGMSNMSSGVGGGSMGSGGNMAVGFNMVGGGPGQHTAMGHQHHGMAPTAAAATDYSNDQMDFSYSGYASQPQQNNFATNQKRSMYY